MFQNLLQRFPFRKLVKFVITGGIALGIDAGVYYFLTRCEDLYYLWARTLSLSVAIVWSFLVNRFWTFHATEGDIRWQAAKFIVVIGSTSLVTLAFMHIGVTILHLHDFSVLFAVAVFTTLINFSGHLLWSYTEKGRY